MPTCFDNRFKCFDDHMLLYSRTWKIICSHVCMLWWSYAPMSTCFNYYMPTCLCTLMLICLDALMITCSHAPMLLCSHVLTCLVVTFVHGSSYSPTLTFGCSLSWLLICLNAHTLTCFDDHMLPSSHALLIRCYYAVGFDDNMLPCTLLLIFTCLISTYTCTHLVDDMSLCLED